MFLIFSCVEAKTSFTAVLSFVFSAPHLPLPAFFLSLSISFDMEELDTVFDCQEISLFEVTTVYCQPAFESLIVYWQALRQVGAILLLEEAIYDLVSNVFQKYSKVRRRSVNYLIAAYFCM